MTGVREIGRFLEQWQLGVKDLRRRMIRSPTPQERERWCALLLLAQGWTGSAVAEALERDPHTIGRWAAAFGDVGPAALIFEQSRGSPRPRQGAARELRAAVQGLPAKSGIELANWNWKVVHRFVWGRWGVSLSSYCCLNYLHRLGFVLKSPKKRLVKADDQKRESFLAECAARWDEAGRSGARIFFADRAHFRTDAELRGKWMLKGEPALVDSTSRAMARRSAITQRCAWRRARWNGWNWRATATPKPRPPFWIGCGRSTPAR